ncbi:hypothetical protein IJJ97_04610, partial [bacterium]|nr:hypothetical protein [bacterium]
MLKKILLLFLVLVFAINFGCTKKVEEEPLLKNDVIVAYESNFDEEVVNVKDKYILVILYEPKCHWCKSS